MHYVQLSLQGVVQGVGFRPFVWQLAQSLQLKGWVFNHSQGVEVFLRCAADQAQAQVQVQKLCQQLKTQLPPLAKIEQLGVNWLDAEVVQRHYPDLMTCEDFQIHHSEASQTMQTLVPADAATCEACLAEIQEPNNRRYRYPFTNCTHCGPRYSIIAAMPYDRHQTSMAQFPLCSACADEYQNPSDRRFHAQPNACADCGPQLSFYSPSPSDSQTWQKLAEKEAWSLIEQTCQKLLAGQLIAIKGIGGFHLVCDAQNDAACLRLRQRKQRPRKPFALMAPDLSTVKAYAHCSEVAAQALQSVAAPIVLLPKKANLVGLSEQVAFDQSRLGIMLPSNPLHHLLMQCWQSVKPGGLLVFTSANLSGQPQIYQEGDLSIFRGLADGVLTHNRAILRRLEDSVCTLNVAQDQVIPLRLARGYAPLQLPLPSGFPALQALAAGGDLKNSLAFQKGQQLTLLHFLGDLENYEVQQAYQQAILDLKQLYDFTPDCCAVDQHPNYYSRQMFQSKLSAQTKTPKVYGVQHHHAHLAAVLLEHQVPFNHSPVMGIILDGLGYGTDHTLWGGELLYGGYAQVQRLAHLAPFPLLGGAQASRQPWRNAYALLKPLADIDTLRQQYPHVKALEWLQEKPLQLLDQMQSRQLNSPMTSSTGRLFDAVAALCGLQFEALSFEGEAAMALENRLSQSLLETQWHQGYPLPLKGETLRLTPLIQAILDDLNSETAVEIISARFHIGLVQGLLQAALHLRKDYPFKQLVLGGGVCQNQWLMWLFEQKCPADMTLLTPKQLPANDQALAIGQLAQLASQVK